jgi:hypothetical protein
MKFNILDILENYTYNKFHENPSILSRVDLCDRRDRRIDGRAGLHNEAIVTIRILANLLKTLSSSKCDVVSFVLHFLILFF